MDGSWLTGLAVELPLHAAIVNALAREVDACEHWRSLLIGCSLGSGSGDALSDIDAGVAYAAPLTAGDLERCGLELVARAGTVEDVLVHHFDGIGDASRRFAVEYDNGVQLDLAVVPAPWHRSRTRDVPIIDKDGDLAQVDVPQAGLRESRVQQQLKEWVMLGWWALSDAAKYLARDSLFEAAARIESVREQALRLFAFSIGIPDPLFGLTSLLDYPPFKLPDGLADTYCRPDDRASVIEAAHAVAALLAETANRAAATAGQDLSTPWARTVTSRLNAIR